MPKQTPELPLPSIRLDSAARLPLHRQLYEQLRGAIRTGDLKPGTRMPSTRALAQELGVSRATTLEAYLDLQAEGYLEAQSGAGTVVVHKLPETFPHAAAGMRLSETGSVATSQLGAAQPQIRLSKRGERLAATSAHSWFFNAISLRPFRMGAPALDATPQRAWTRAVTQAVRHATPEQLDYHYAAGYYPLRKAIAAYLAVARGVRCSAEQVIIVAGIQAGLSLTANVLLDPQDVVWMEEPGYFLAQALFQTADATLIPVPVDGEGICVSAGQALRPDARLAYVTPSHQFPLGITMSYARRRELLQWAQQANAWIIEDDYDSEYRYTGRPIPALQGLDETGRVIYLGTFSKVFFPALRLGYLVVPPTLVDPFAAAQRIMSFHPPLLEQIAMTAFITDGDFTRHIRRMRGLYAERRDSLLTYVSHYLADKLDIAATPSGLHLVGWLPEAANEHERVTLADQQGVTVYPLSQFCLGSTARKGLVLGFAAYSEHEIKAAVQKLAHTWSKIP